MDGYYLNDAVENFNVLWQKAGNPGEMGHIVFQRLAPHSRRARQRRSCSTR